MKKNYLCPFIVITMVFVSIMSYAQTETGFQWSASPSADSMLNSEGDPIFATVLSFSTDDATADPLSIMDPSNWTSWADVASTLGNPLSAMSTPKNVPLFGRFTTGTTSGTDPSIIGDYAWAIVLDMDIDDYVDVASIPMSTWYTAVGLSSSPIANLFDSDTGTTASPQEFNVDAPVQTMMMIPEPGTIAFVLFGIGVLGARRFMKTRKG